MNNSCNTLSNNSCNNVCISIRDNSRNNSSSEISSTATSIIHCPNREHSELSDECSISILELDETEKQIARGSWDLIKKIATNGKVYECSIDIIMDSCKLLDLKIGESLEIVEKFLKTHGIYEDYSHCKVKFDPSLYLYGSDKQASEVVKSYANFHFLASNAVKVFTKIVELGNIESLNPIKEMCKTIIAPFLKTTLGQPLKIFAKYQSLQTALAMPEKSEQEKQTKKLLIAKCKGELLKVGMNIATTVSGCTNPAILVPLTAYSLALGILDGYLVYNSMSAKKTEQVSLDIHRNPVVVLDESPV